MDNNEFSFESIFAAGVGMPVEKTVEVQSEERFDGFEDGLWNDYYRAQEELEFVETFDSMESYNTKLKLDMLNKINKAYGKCNRGIENYCRIQSLEAETDDKPNDTEKVNEKLKWYQVIWKRIKEFVLKIINLIKSLFFKIKQRFSKFGMMVQAIKKASDEERRNLMAYLNNIDLEKEYSADNYNYIVIKNDTIQKLNQKTEEYLNVVNTSYRKAIQDLSENKLDSVQSFFDSIKHLSSIYSHMNNKDITTSLNRTNYDKSDMKSIKNFIREINDKALYTCLEYTKHVHNFSTGKDEISSSKNIFLSDFNSNIIDPRNKITLNNIFGTNDILSILDIIDKSLSESEKICKTLNKALYFAKEINDKFNTIIVDKIREDKIDIEAARTLTLSFNLVTYLSNIYFGVFKDLNYTISNSQKAIVKGSKVHIKKMSNKKLDESDVDHYNKKVNDEIHNMYVNKPGSLSY